MDRAVADRAVDVPFVGYPLALVAIFLALRTRRRGDERYQGLRILR